MSEEKKNLYKIVSQDSELGSLGLSALLNAGFCGPPCDLSDCSVWIWEGDDSFNIEFYDMSCEVTKLNKCCSDLKEAYDER